MGRVKGILPLSKNWVPAPHPPKKKERAANPQFGQLSPPKWEPNFFSDWISFFSAPPDPGRNVNSDSLTIEVS